MSRKWSQNQQATATTNGQPSKEEEEFGMDTRNLLSTSAPLVDLPISREGLVPEDFTIPTRQEFIEEQKADSELARVRSWLDSKHQPSADERGRRKPEVEGVRSTS